MNQEEKYEKIYLSTVLISRYTEGEGYSLDDALREKGIDPNDPNLEFIEKDSDNTFIEYDVYKKVKVPVRTPIPPIKGGPEGQIPPTRGGSGGNNPPHKGDPEGNRPPTRGGQGGPTPPTRGGEGENNPPTKGKPDGKNPPEKGGPEGQIPPARGGGGENNPPSKGVPEGTRPPTREGQDGHNPPTKGKPEGKNPPEKDGPATPKPPKKGDSGHIPGIKTRIEEFEGIDFELEDPDIDELEQDMLDKYYGNRAKEKEYKKRIKRFKSHIIERNIESPNGTIKYYCVEDYPEYKEDARFLQLQEYSARLERLSRAEAGDDSLYQNTAAMYIRGLKRSGTSEIPSLEDTVKILRMLDAEYIETNNYAYNQHVNTRDNLKTLGKYGEKVPFLPMSKENKASAKLGNVVRGVVNGTILLKNCSTALLHSLAGTYVVSPIHQLLINSERNHAGLYKSKLTHRYEARKGYFEYQILKEYEEENERRRQNNEPLKKLNFLKLAFVPRIKSILKYKEGNKAVLNAGATDIVQSAQMIRQDAQYRQNELARLHQEFDQVLSEILELERLHKEGKLNESYYPKFDLLFAKLAEIRNKVNIIKRTSPSIIQTDAVSMNIHDRANKQNITNVVTGVKIPVRAAAMRYIGPKIKKVIQKATTKSVEVEEEVVRQGEPIYEIIKPEVRKKLISGDGGAVDLYQFEDNGLLKVWESVRGKRKTRTIGQNSQIVLRGAAIKRGNQVISIGDQADFVTRKLVDRYEKIQGNETILDILAKLNEMTKEELIAEINNATDPMTRLKELMGDELYLWVSSSKKGTPVGWHLVSKQAYELLEGSSEETIVSEGVKKIIGYEEIVETVKTVKDIPLITEVTAIDHRYAILQSLLILGGISDLNDLLRRTRDKAEMIGEKSLDYPQKGRDKLNPNTATKPHQRDNKAHLGQRHYDNDQFGFEGTRRGDRASAWNEAGMDTPTLGGRR